MSDQERVEYLNEDEFAHIVREGTELYQLVIDNDKLLADNKRLTAELKNCRDTGLEQAKIIRERNEQRDQLTAERDELRAAIEQLTTANAAAIVQLGKQKQQLAAAEAERDEWKEIACGEAMHPAAPAGGEGEGE